MRMLDCPPPPHGWPTVARQPPSSASLSPWTAGRDSRPSMAAGLRYAARPGTKRLDLMIKKFRVRRPIDQLLAH